MTYDFAEQHDVLPADEEQPTPLFRKRVTGVYSFDGVFQHQIGYIRRRTSRFVSARAHAARGKRRTELVVGAEDAVEFASVAEDDEHLSWRGRKAGGRGSMCGGRRSRAGSAQDGTRVRQVDASRRTVHTIHQ